MYNLFSSDIFDNAISRYLEHNRRRIDNNIVELQTDPYANKRLSGTLSDIRSLRVGRERVFYRVCEDCRTQKDYEIWQCLDCKKREDDSIILFNVGPRDKIHELEERARKRKRKRKRK